MATDNTQTLEATEKALDAIEERLDELVPEIVETVEVVRNNPVLLVGIGLVGVGVGVAVGYHFAKKHLRVKFDDLLAQEVEQARQFYATLNKADYPTPTDLVKERHPEVIEAERIAKEQGYTTDGESIIVAPEDGTLMIRRQEVEVETEQEVQHRNIFVDGSPIDEDAWDQTAEELNRTPGKPYVISEEEFMENETDYEQLQMTYWVADDVLVSEETSEVVNASDELVGDENLRTKFGHGSKDRHILYVRNDAKRLEFEIAQSTGSYTKEILGLNDEDNERIQQQVRRFRARGSDD